MRFVKLFPLALALGCLVAAPLHAQNCVTCHKVMTPGIVTDWQLSKHRMRAFQGTFQPNPDYALWYGWSEMQRDLGEIRSEAEEMRYRATARK